jgi:lipopolysaccharide transport system ATP-binding protein
MSDVLIKADGVSKKFAKDLKKSLLYGLADVTRGVLGKPFEEHLRKDEFWAVQDVSFEVRRGECLGLIGHNGAGKSTLLKMLNGLIRPDKGRIEMRGRIGALIELGAGFNPILTGRENIYNSGAVLGFTRAEINKKFDEIVAFSELEDFLDMPVQSYSSGMKVRLGFAVAAHTEPDVLLIDEVLAVGDLGFRIKCMNRIAELLSRCSVIFVSHSMTQIGKICTTGILLNDGEVQLKSDIVSDVINKYFTRFSSEKPNRYGVESIYISDIIIHDEKESKEIFTYLSELKLEFTLNNLPSEIYLVIDVIIFDLELKAVGMFNSPIFYTDFPVDTLNRFNLKFLNQLVKGKYSLTIDVSKCSITGSTKTPLVSFRNILSFNSDGSGTYSYCPVQFLSDWERVQLF